MSTIKNTNNQFVGFEPELKTVFYPGCKNCGTAHPIVLKARDTTKCPECGEPSGKPGSPNYVDASFTVRSLWALPARALFSIGGALSKFAKRIEP